MGALFDWEPDMIRFMRQCVAYTQFPAHLVKRIVPHLPKQANVCDGGCGTGYLTMALAPYVRHITGADRSQAAIAQLRQDAAGIDNLDAVCCDLLTYTPAQPFDAMVFMQFGGIDDILQISRQCCRGPVIMISRNRKKHRFSGDGAGRLCFHYSGICARLEELGIPYQSSTFVQEMGQPFASLEDALHFFEIYHHGTPLTESQIRQRLQPDPQGQYAYYMPVQNELGMIIFDAGKLQAER